MERKIKMGLIGLGAIGAGTYIPILRNHERVEVVGVCDTVTEDADRYASELNTHAYYSYEDLFDKSELEAVIIAVPHYAHTPIAIEAFKRGLHVLCEKPIAVHVNDAKKMVDAYEEARLIKPDLIFAIMFQERTYPFHRKLKDLIEGGELGRLTRVSWINTQWFRSQLYYDSGGWRATWAGEGGGILTNQCPHNMDLYQWLFGMPERVHGVAHIGKYHHIEVEDEVTAYFEHANGMIGHFFASTGETPGTNRMEIVGEYGKLLLEGNKLTFYRNRSSMLQYIHESKNKFGGVESWYTEIPVDQDQPTSHPVVFEGFIHSIHLGESELIARGVDGMNGLTLANAIMLSSFTGQTIQLPMDADVYEAKLKQLADESRYVKTIRDAQEEDINGSFSSG